MTPEQAAELWSGRLSTRHYQPVLVIPDMAQLMSTLRPWFRDPVVFGRSRDIGTGAVIKYCKDKIRNADQYVILYGGSSKLARILVPGPQSGIQKWVLHALDNFDQSEQFQSYAAGAFQEPEDDQRDWW